MRSPAIRAVAVAVVAALALLAACTDDGETSPTPRPVLPGSAGTTPTPDLPGWVLTFAEEFDGTTVDGERWYVLDEGTGDEVESPKETTCPLADNVSVEGGRLVLRTRQADGDCAGGQPFAGAGVTTHQRFAQAGGRFEARARWTTTGNYLWGGFWTHGNLRPGYRREDASEIDVFEYIGRDAEPNRSRFRPAIHYSYACTGTCGTQNLTRRPHDVTAWHTYAVEWDPAEEGDPSTMEIRFLLDDELIGVFDRDGAWSVDADGDRTQEADGGWGNPGGPFPHPFGFDRPQVLILSAWVGAPETPLADVEAGFSPPEGTAALEVDHVRAYARP